MTIISRSIRLSAAAACAAISVSATAPAARADDYCLMSTSGMRGCGYTSLAQCQARASGASGYCDPNPFGSSANASNAMAQSTARHKTRRHD
ncbi:MULTISPECIES: DUF3551 domain-containing protein [unclassified Bradyrhizobium]|uniref:DUF3551 domain-containing protein n=1 Tax=unclassified Bradyrhizobium TaxID=2631580 RepID=UPI0028EF48C8|nr:MULTISPECIES: DUF3551 domain-containing protein [unclassified Bradyrhizobium]